MHFFIQDPTFEKSYTLHEALVDAAEGSSSGGGAYAFVSLEGIKLFVEDSAFAKLAKHGVFTLVVGIDDITSEKVLTKLKEIQSNYGSGLKIYAFFHDNKGSLFHPKFSWFRKNDGGTLIVGSGNLTGRGLRVNREAFTYSELSEEQILHVEEYWNTWLQENSKYLKPIDDEAVLEKAKSNTRFYLEQRRKHEAKVVSSSVEEKETKPVIETHDIEDLKAWIFSSENEVLIAEIPKNGDRLKQVNFNKFSFTTFFGAEAGVNGKHKIILKYVTPEGLLGETEVRPSVSVKSKNWRFELDALKGVPYPEDGRPIGVFIKVSVRTFLYHLLLPGNPCYIEVMKLINQLNKDGSKFRREITSVSELKRSCSNLPFWYIKES